MSTGGRSWDWRAILRKLTWKHGLAALAAAGVALGVGGCTRKFYRKQADSEVAHALEAKDQYPVWKIEAYGDGPYPDPRARFADPSNPDRPPMPPDDPAAKALSPCPQKPRKAGG